MKFGNIMLVALLTVFMLVTSFNPNSSEWLRVEASEYSNTALLSWYPPTQNEDGTALTDLAGYKIYMGTTPGEYTETIPVGVGLTSYMIENLNYGTTYYFVMTALNTAGLESQKSNEVFKQIKSGMIDPEPEPTPTPVVPTRPKAPTVSAVAN